MATYSYNYITYLGKASDGSWVTSDFVDFNPGTFSDIDDNETSSTFEVGERVNGSGLGDGTGIYQGFGEDGLFVEYEFTGDYVYYSQTEPPAFIALSISTETYTVCFLAGTEIACPGTSRKVEDLAIGDMILTSTGHARPVRWIGRQNIVSVFANPLQNYPIRIAAGALEDNMPCRDLFVSPEHALLVDGLLVQAGALVNGTSITQLTHPAERFTYYHIELDDHSLVLAEGTPAETFVDNVTRRRFDNYAEYEALHPENAPHIAEIDLPRVKSARQLPQQIRQRLAKRAVIAIEAAA